MIIDDYINYSDTYFDKYGDNTVVLMEVGSFFEIYAIDNEFEKKGADIFTISNILNITVSRKNKNVIENDRKNHLLAGFPNHALTKFIDILITNNYTIVLIEQVTPPPNPKREVTNIISPSTYFENTSINDTNNFFMHIYVENGFDRKNKKTYYAISWCAIDVSTGKVYLNDINQDICDNKIIFEELFRILLTFKPSEICLSSADTINNDLITDLNLHKSNQWKFHNHLRRITPEFKSKSFQQEILGYCYKNTHTQLNIFEFLNIEYMLLGSMCLVYAIHFLYNHSPLLLKKISVPIIQNELDDNLKLVYNCASQLNIINNGSYNEICLIDLLNRCETAIGRRYFKYRMLHPTRNCIKLNESYYTIELFSKLHQYNTCFKITNIYDIQRLYRKTHVNKLNPLELFNLYTSIQNIQNILNILNDDIINSLKLNKYELNTSINHFVAYIDSIFNITELQKKIAIDYTIFNLSINEQLQILSNTYDETYNKFLNIVNYLNSLVKDTYFKLEYNDRDKYHLCCTTKRYNSFLKLHNQDAYITECEFECKHLSNSSTNNLKITSKSFSIWNSILNNTKHQIQSIVTELYKDIISTISNEYTELFEQCVKFIEQVDFFNTCAKNAIKFNLCKPILDDTTDVSYLDAKQLRHTIVEHVNQEVEYVANDILLNENGIILYGINASGKSCLMKSIGLAIIMAQSGMYVTASAFKFSPYHHVFTRITNNDNLYKNQSSFVLEMSELRNILKIANKNSLIIGDELCSGTESVSAISIVASGIMSLSTKKSSFIFATHLHELCKVDEISKLSNVHICHLNTTFDENSGLIIYDRILKNGFGNTLYGLEVCKSLDLDDEFIRNATIIRRKLEGETELVDNKSKSMYSSNIWKTYCKICEKKAHDVHHINEQNCADRDGNINNKFHKNSQFNLIPLCKECHTKVHNNELTINGYKHTSNGIMIDFIWNNASKTKDESFNMIKRIHNMYYVDNKTKTNILNIINAEFQIQMSRYKLEKIINLKSFKNI